MSSTDKPRQSSFSTAQSSSLRTTGQSIRSRATLAEVLTSETSSNSNGSQDDIATGPSEQNKTENEGNGSKKDRTADWVRNLLKKVKKKQSRNENDASGSKDEDLDLPKEEEQKK